MDLNLKEKVIIVTGGSKGIGNGICNVLASEGAIPIIIGRNEKDILNAIEVIENNGGKAFYALAELTKPEDCKNAVAKVKNEFGRIDGVVNNAGVNDSVGLEHGNYEDFIASAHKNLVHYYLIAHHALPALKKSKGSIVN